MVDLGHEGMCARACVRTCVRACVRMNAYVYTLANMHTYTYIHTNILVKCVRMSPFVMLSNN